MALTDTCCTLVPYFKIHEDKLEEFRRLGERFVEKTQTEPKCMHYGFSFNGLQAHCREGYADAEGILAHLENVGALLDEAFKIAEITRLEISRPRRRDRETARTPERIESGTLYHGDRV